MFIFSNTKKTTFDQITESTYTESRVNLSIPMWKPWNKKNMGVGNKMQALTTRDICIVG